MVQRPEDSSAFPRKPTKTEHDPKSTSSSSVRLQHSVELPKSGPGSTWLNLTKKDVDDYISRQKDSQEKGARRSLPGRLLYGFIKRLVRKT